MIPPPLLFINIKYILLLFFHPYNSPPPISYHCRLFSCGPTLHYHRPTPTPPSPLLSSTLTSLPYHLLSTLTPPPPIYIRHSTPLVSIASQNVGLDGFPVSNENNCRWFKLDGLLRL